MTTKAWVYRSYKLLIKNIFIFLSLILMNLSTLAINSEQSQDGKKVPIISPTDNNAAINHTAVNHTERTPTIYSSNATSNTTFNKNTERSSRPLWQVVPQVIQGRLTPNKEVIYQLDLDQLQQRLSQINTTATFTTDLQTNDSTITKGTEGAAETLEKEPREEPTENSSQAFMQTPETESSLQNNQKTASNQAEIRLPLPTPDGRFVEFVLAKSAVMPSKLAAKYPDITAYIGYQVDKPHFSGRFERTPLGFYAIFYQQDRRIVIDPVVTGTNETQYRVYQESSLPRFDSGLFQRPTDRVIDYFDRSGQNGQNQRPSSQSRSFGQQGHQYRLAVSTAAEYTQFHGGTVALGLAAVVTAINRVNLVYERDLAIHLQLVDDNDQLIFTNASTDPFDNTTNDINDNTGVINNIIGTQNYDVGHIFNTAAGGLAGIGVVCTNVKGAGITGLANPINDLFYIDFVAHEIGHQFSAAHTYNAGSGNCGSNRVATSAYEPGSGSTIMSYAGLCGSQNIQGRSDVMFHSHSINQIRSFIETGDGQFCGTRLGSSNTPPSITAGNDYIIPRTTPFVLSGQGTDSETSQTLSFSWEQIDLGQITNSSSDMLAQNDRPLFRSFEPSNSPVRYLPKLENLLANFNDLGEQLPTAGRTLNFRLTGRDGNGGVNMDSMRVVVSDQAGPFIVTQPSLNNSYQPGQNLTIQWDTANTQLAPINCQTVDIHIVQPNNISTDFLLATATPNDGEHMIEIPNQSISAGRIKVGCTNNIFYNVSAGKVNISPNSVDLAITGQQSIDALEDTPFAIALSDLFITDAILDPIAPLELLIKDGTHYGYDGNTIYPAANFNGQLTINTQLQRGSISSDIFSLIVSIVAVNDIPVITEFNGHTNYLEDEFITVNKDDFTIYDVDASNPYDTADISLLIDNDNIQLTSNGFIPPENFNGELLVKFRASDGISASSIFSVPFNLEAINDAPFARDDLITSSSNIMTLRPLANDFDAEGSDTLMIQSLQYSGPGTASVSSDQKTIQCQVVETFKGDDVINYTITDQEGLTATATINIVIGEETQSTSSGGGSLGMGIYYLLLLLLIGRLYQQRHLYSYH